MEVRYGSLDEWAWEALFRTIGVETDGFHRYRKLSWAFAKLGGTAEIDPFVPLLFSRGTRGFFVSYIN